jgi:hypothetical protein
MEKEQLKRKVAWLESRLDQVETELSQLNQQLILCGFPGGVKTLKSTINDLLAEGPLHPHNPEDYPPTQTFDPFSL